MAFIAIEERENTIAHHLLSTYANNNAQKYLDYLVSNTPGLETYRQAIKYKPIVLPAMQKKAEKKQPQTSQQQKTPQPGKPKAKIFDREDEPVAKPPPPILPPKKREEPQDTGFSPYDTPKPAESVPAPKKNLNTPPPPPVSHKKPIHVQEEEEPQRDVPPPPQQPPKNLPIAPPKKQTPPPPPPSHHQAE